MQDEQQAPRRTGRPPKPEGERKRLNRTFRVNDRMNSMLELAAQQNQRSVSEEIEYRLERSFSDDTLIEMLVSRSVQGNMVRRIIDVVRKTRDFCALIGKNETETREAVRAAAFEVVDVYCWYGQDLPSRAHVERNGLVTPKLLDRTPEQIGGEIADSAMMGAGGPSDPLMADLGERVLDYWTGQGKIIAWTPQSD